MALPDVLLQAKTTGQALATEGDYEKHKLDASNVGYQMLQQAGWTAGQGLGAHATGVLNPIDVK